jgi:hypothetical protein
MYFTYFAVVGMVSLWLPILFFARGAATDFLRGLAWKSWAVRLGSRGQAGEVLGSLVVKCICFCYLGLELALTRGSVALLGPIPVESHAAIRVGALTLAWLTGACCVLRALPVFLEGWKFLAGNLPGPASMKTPPGEAA